MRNTQPISARLVATLASLALCVLALSPLTAAAQPASAPEATSAAAPAAPAPMAPAPVAAKETVDNPYGLGALWEQGDFVAQAIQFAGVFS